MDIRTIVVGLTMTAVLAMPAPGQGTGPDTARKPGGVNKVARDVTKTMKKAGRDTKAELKRGSSTSHSALTKAGNDTKAELKRTTGVSSKTPDSTHKPGGLNKVARKVSSESKKAGAQVKKAAKQVSADGHAASTRAGKDAKAEAKRATPPRD